MGMEESGSRTRDGNGKHSTGRGTDEREPERRTKGKGRGTGKPTGKANGKREPGMRMRNQNKQRRDEKTGERSGNWRTAKRNESGRTRKRKKKRNSTGEHVREDEKRGQSSGRKSEKREMRTRNQNRGRAKLKENQSEDGSTRTTMGSHNPELRGRSRSGRKSPRSRSSKLLQARARSRFTPDHGTIQALGFGESGCIHRELELDGVKRSRAIILKSRFRSGSGSGFERGGCDRARGRGGKAIEDEDKGEGGSKAASGPL